MKPTINLIILALLLLASAALAPIDPGPDGLPPHLFYNNEPGGNGIGDDGAYFQPSSGSGDQPVAVINGDIIFQTSTSAQSAAIQRRFRGQASARRWGDSHARGAGQDAGSGRRFPGAALRPVFRVER